MNIMYSNISGGLVFAGQKYGELLFSKVSVDDYVTYFKDKNLDVLSLSEVHLEDKTTSGMVAYIAGKLGMEHYASLALSDSHLDTSKKLGMAVISRFPIARQEEFTIPSPKLEVDRPNGEHWVMFDKGGQRVYLDVDGKEISVVNFSYFPFHHFNRRVDEPEFAPLRNQLLTVLTDNPSNAPTIITGDFNSRGIPVPQAFPELFAGDALRQAVDVPTTVIGYGSEQLDHILYQPQHFTATGGYAEVNASDHLAIGAQLTLK